MTKGVIVLHRNLRSRLSEFSKEEFSDYMLPHIIFNSSKEVLIEGSKGVLEYKEDVVRINCGNYILKFKGENLSILSPTADELSISGEIISFEFTSI